MKTHFRPYTDNPGFGADFQRVREFLVRINRTNPIRYDFEWGRWEWAFSLPFLDETSLGRIGLWECDGKIVGLATYETGPGTVYFALDPAHHELKAEMLAYAAESLRSPDGEVKVLINNADAEFQRIALDQGFVPTQETEGNAVFDVANGRMVYVLPPGYAITTLSDDVDILKFNRVLWRGFDHPGEPPATSEALNERRKSLAGPDLDLALCIVVLAPSGDYAAYCGMWHDPQTHYALVEPVATDPDHRRLGLGKAAVLEGIRRCGERGATEAYVGSSLQFYYQIGFRPLPAGTFWQPRVA